MWGERGYDTLYDDARTMSASSRGGADKLYGGSGTDRLYGEGNALYDSARGGADYLRRDSSTGVLHGDAASMYGNALGGNDSRYGSSSNDTLYGDAYAPFDQSKGGHDYLNGGSGNDTLYGDARSTGPGAGYETTPFTAVLATTGLSAIPPMAERGPTTSMAAAETTRWMAGVDGTSSASRPGPTGIRSFTSSPVKISSISGRGA